MASLTSNNDLCEKSTTIGEMLFSKSLVQNISKQDACGFVNTKKLSILWCSDSHGGRKDNKKFVIRDFLNNISDEKWIEYVSQEDFHIAEKDGDEFKSNLFKDIALQGPFADTGATLSIIKITDTHIETYRVGDSPILIFREGKVILYSNHQEEYDSDMIELKKRKKFNYIDMKCPNGNGVRDAPDIQLISTKIMTLKPSNYINWDSGCSTNMTRSIGHNNPISFDIRQKLIKENIELSLPSWTMTKEVIERVPNTKEKIIVGSDGVMNMCGEFDYEMLYESQASTIMDVVLNRWKQQWAFKVEGYATRYETLPDWNRDDMALVICTNNL